MKPDERVYAVNWFNTRSMWLYNLYNFLAAPLVKKVNATAFLKAKVQKIIVGSQSDFRDILLIVTYPKAKHFKSLLEMTLFKFVSLFRILSVKDFTFCFTRRVGEYQCTSINNSEEYYALHHYKSSVDVLAEIQIACKKEKIELHYLGITSAVLFSGDDTTQKEQVPCLMDAMVVFKSDNTKKIECFIRSEKYQSIINKTQNSFIAEIDKIL